MKYIEFIIEQLKIINNYQDFVIKQLKIFIDNSIEIQRQINTINYNINILREN